MDPTNVSPKTKKKLTMDATQLNKMSNPSMKVLKNNLNMDSALPSPKEKRSGVENEKLNTDPATIY